MQLAGRGKKGVPPPSACGVAVDRLGAGEPREIGRRAFLGLLACGLSATVIEHELGLWSRLRSWFFPPVSKVVRLPMVDANVFEHARQLRELAEVISARSLNCSGCHIGRSTISAVRTWKSPARACGCHERRFRTCQGSSITEVAATRQRAPNRVV